MLWALGFFNFVVYEKIKQKTYCSCLFKPIIENRLSLSEYLKKLDFQKTTEPKGDVIASEHRLFVSQKHASSNLHFDLRLEMNGVLKSWSVPQEPPTSFVVKGLAVQVEDHPIEYADFEGIIPEGAYGAGTVKICDKGSYQLIESKKDKLILDIGGAKLSHLYVLIRLKDKKLAIL